MTVKGHHIVEEDIELILDSFGDWEEFRDKTILISGANGFLPSYMIFALLKANEKFRLNLYIIGLVRNREKAEKKFSNHLGDFFSLLVQDVTQSISVGKKLDIIIHAASQASPKFYGVDPVGTLNANVLGTNNLLLLAKEHNVQSFLFFSSSEVYGEVAEMFIPIKENGFGYLDITNVRSCYAEGKRLGETMCVSWLIQYNVPVKIVRPFHTYGPGMDLNDGRVFADFVSNVVNGKDIVLKSDGSAKRAFCYLADAVLGFLTVLIRGKNGQAYNVGNPDTEISIYDLALLLTSLYSEKGIKVVREINENSSYLKSSVSRNSPNIDKLVALGWRPSTTLSKGFSKTIDSYGWSV